MTEPDHIAAIREMRARGLSPKEISRATGIGRARVTAIIRELAQDDAERQGRAVIGCWVNSGWNTGLSYAPRAGWSEGKRSNPEGTGLAAVVVARRQRGARVTACGFLVDTHCLGVKNAMGPQAMSQHDLERYVRLHYAAFDAPPLEIPLDLARHLVLGAEEYARGLGFEPHADFTDTRAHLGEWDGDCAITFGRDGQPFYCSGPFDDVEATLRTLNRSVGAGNYGQLVGLGAR